MESKLRAVNKLQKIAEKQREQQGALLERLRRQADHYQEQLEALGELRSGCACTTLSGALSSATLQNSAGAQAMLTGMLNHHQHEKVLLDAECEFSQRQLEAYHARVKGLETVAERWKRKQDYEKAKKEQRFIEEMINARHKKTAG